MFQESIANDPDMVRQLLRPLVGAIIPIAAGDCTAVDGPGSSEANKLTKWSNTNCTLTNSAIVESGGNVGINVSSPTTQLQIKPTSASPIHVDRIGNGDGNGERWNIAVLNAGGTDVLSFGQSSSNYTSGGIPWIGNSNAFFYFGGTQQFRIGAGTSPTIPWLTVVGSTGNIGLTTESPTHILSLGGAAHRTIWVERQTASNTAGSNLTVQAGGATSGATDKNGGNLVLNSGIATGTGSSQIHFQTATAGASGTADRSPSTKMVIDGAGNVGIGTASPDSKFDVRGSINQVVYLRPNGSTDGTQINNAITALPSNGGIIYLQPGEYHINTTISVNKNGVKLRGYGSGDPSTPGASYNPLTKLLWTGSADGTVVELKPSSTNARVQDVELSDLSIDGATTNPSGIGLVLDRVINSKFINVRVCNCTGSPGTGIKLTTTANGSPTGNDIGTSWNHFENCSVLESTTGLHLTGETTGSPAAVANACHNTFISLNIQGNSVVTGIKLESCDNNSFYRVLTPGTGSGGSERVGVLIANPADAYSNYFYHLQAGGANYGLKVENAPNLPFNGTKNFIFGYDRVNSEIEPKAFNSSSSQVDATPFLFWTESDGHTNGMRIKHYSLSSALSSSNWPLVENDQVATCWDTVKFWMLVQEGGNKWKVQMSGV